MILNELLRFKGLKKNMNLDNIYVIYRKKWIVISFSKDTFLTISAIRIQHTKKMHLLLKSILL